MGGHMKKLADARRSLQKIGTVSCDWEEEQMFLKRFLNMLMYKAGMAENFSEKNVTFSAEYGMYVFEDGYDFTEMMMDEEMDAYLKGPMAPECVFFPMCPEGYADDEQKALRKAFPDSDYGKDTRVSGHYAEEEKELLFRRVQEQFYRRCGNEKVAERIWGEYGFELFNEYCFFMDYEEEVNPLNYLLRWPAVDHFFTYAARPENNVAEAPLMRKELEELADIPIADDANICGGHGGDDTETPFYMFQELYRGDWKPAFAVNYGLDFLIQLYTVSILLEELEEKYHFMEAGDGK